MAYRVFRGGTEIADEPLATLDEAQELVKSEIARHPGSVPAPFGLPDIWWSWSLGALQARSADNGMVAYSIRPVA